MNAAKKSASAFFGGIGFGTYFLMAIQKTF
jgi:hypothetical protein